MSRDAQAEYWEGKWQEARAEIERLKAENADLRRWWKSKCDIAAEIAQRALEPIFNIRAGDEIIYGKLKGVRFWTYRPPCTITSFQHHSIGWVPGQPAQSEGELPMLENGYGLNVYKTVVDAMRGSTDAISGVLRDNGADIGAWSWVANRSGIVLGEVEFWGPMVEHEVGYRAQYVQPTRFLRAWGYKPEQIVRDLNALWFGEKHG